MEERFIPGGPRRKNRKRPGGSAVVLILLLSVLAAGTMLLQERKAHAQEGMQQGGMRTEDILLCMEKGRMQGGLVFEEFSLLAEFLGFAPQVPAGDAVFRQGNVAVYENGMEVTMHFSFDDGNKLVYEMSCCTSLKAARAVEEMYGLSGTGMESIRAGENRLLCWREGTVCHRLIGRMDEQTAAEWMQRCGTK